MTRISFERPSRPTWIGDRIQAATVWTERDLDLDFAVVWPYLWLSMPNSTRSEVTTARAAITRGATLGAWALLYLPLIWWWWPASLITATVAVTSRYHLRSAAETYATILEAATRHHLRDLASHLGFSVDGEVKRSTDDALTRHLLPSAPSEPPT